MAIRSPIVSVLGHVDHGKSSILDAVRGTNIVRHEAGAITQAIGASIMPIDVIKKRCGELIEKLGMKVTVPGLLFIDTPGHAAFTTLRKRGGSLADIAILVVDINEGFKPQTVEAIEILRSTKTPFVIAANKVDLIPGFQVKNKHYITNLKNQSENTMQVLEERLYGLVGTLHEKFGMIAERYDRVESFTKNIAIVPCSAMKNVGLDELLMVITGLSQRYLEQNLNLNVEGPAKAVIVEVKEDKGLGKTIDTIVYDGKLEVGETVVIGTLEGAKTAKIRALLMPHPLMDMRDKKSKFQSVKSVSAATGVKISSPDIDENVIAGMPLVGVEGSDAESVLESVNKQIHEFDIKTEKKGVLIKADTIGGLEALANLLSEKDIPVRKAAIGPVSKKDIADAESNYESDPLHSAILGFNLSELESTEKVKIIVRDVIYSIIDDFEKWRVEKEKELEEQEIGKFMRPAKIEVLENCYFRQSNPCIVGVEVLSGSLKTGTRLIDMHGNKVSEIKSIQSGKENLSVAEKGRQVAISLPNVTAGRQVRETEYYYSDLDEDTFRKLKKHSKYLTEGEIETLKEIASVKRKTKPLWGV